MNKKIIHLVDDSFDLETQNKIEEILTNPHFPWFYQKRSTSIRFSSLYQREEDYFSHIFSNNDMSNSDFNQSFFLPTFYEILKKVTQFYGKENFSVLRSKVNFYKKTNNIFEYRHLPFHTDSSLEHKTLIYYVNDSEGKTIFINKEKIKPKKGRLIFFDGDLIHSMRLPVFRNRMVININLILN